MNYKRSQQRDYEPTQHGNTAFLWRPFLFVGPVPNHSYRMNHSQRAMDIEPDE